MADSELEQNLARWRGAGLIAEQTAEALRAFEAQRAAAAAPAGGAARAADAAACLAAGLITAAALVLAFAQFEHDLGARSAVLSIVGAAALAASFAARRLRLAAAADTLGAAAVLLPAACLASGLNEVGGEADAALGWALICAAVLLLGGAVWRWIRSRSAGVLALLAWVALPAGLLVSNGAGSGVFAPSLESVSDALVWTALALMTAAAALAALAAQLAARRDWIDRRTALYASFTAAAALSAALVFIVLSHGESELYYTLPAGAAAATALPIWRQEWIWLPPSAVLFVTGGWASLVGGADSSSERTLGLLVLVLSLAVFTPLTRRLPQHWTVRAWEGAIWLNTLLVACMFALAPDGWPAAGGLWGAAMILCGALLRRWLALAIGAAALYATFIAVVIETFGASAGAGFGTLLFGLLVLAAVIFWRRRLHSAAAAAGPAERRTAD